MFNLMITIRKLYLREQGCEDPWLFFETKRGPRANKSLENTTLKHLYYHIHEFSSNGSPSNR
jgi:hypothetical protein